MMLKIEQYTYDKAGNRLTETEKNKGNSVVKNYEYDNENRLIKISTNTNEETNFKYDNNGNLLSEIQSNSSTLKVEKTRVLTKVLGKGAIRDRVASVMSLKAVRDKVNDVATSLKRSLDKFNTNGTSSKTYTLPGDLNSLKCFTAGTLVKTELGNKEIQDIQVGDKVYARNVVTYDNCSFKPTNKITSVEIKGTDLEKQFIGDKYSRLDIKATTNNNEIINIEIQLRNEYNMIQRSTHLKGNITSYSFRDVSSTNQIQDLEYHLSKMYQES